MTDLEAVLATLDGHARTVLQYTLTVERLVSEAKTPGFDAATWEPLLRIVDTEKFVRVGNFKEVMGWADYAAFLTGWASSAQWDCTLRRITEVEGRVYLELEERSVVGEFRTAVNSLSVFEFADDGRIGRIDVYLQMELPAPELLAGLVGG